MAKIREFPLTAYLAMLSASVASPIVLVCAYLLVSEANRQRAEVTVGAMRIAKQISSDIDLKIEKLIGIGQTLAQLPVIDVKSFDEVARNVAREQKITVAIRDRSGRQARQ